MGEQAEAGWAATVGGLAAQLEGGRSRLWQDVAQRIAVLLAAPAAFNGEHFVQVPPPFPSPLAHQPCPASYPLSCCSTTCRDSWCSAVQAHCEYQNRRSASCQLPGLLIGIAYGSAAFHRGHFSPPSPPHTHTRARARARKSARPLSVMLRQRSLGPETGIGRVSAKKASGLWGGFTDCIKPAQPPALADPTALQAAAAGICAGARRGCCPLHGSTASCQPPERGKASSGALYVLTKPAKLAQLTKRLDRRFPEKLGGSLFDYISQSAECRIA